MKKLLTKRAVDTNHEQGTTRKESGTRRVPRFRLTRKTIVDWLKRLAGLPGPNPVSRDEWLAAFRAYRESHKPTTVEPTLQNQRLGLAEMPRYSGPHLTDWQERQPSQPRESTTPKSGHSIRRGE